MQFKNTLVLLSTLASMGMALPHAAPESVAKRGDWTATPSGKPSTKGFGGRTPTTGGTVDTYTGNVGDTWGTNIIEIDEESAPDYNYVARVTGHNQDPWTVVFWNKFGPSGQFDGHYGNSALTFKLGPGETKFIAFDENTQGALGAAKGDKLPTGPMGAYASTWGEFDFANGENDEWSGFDVSAIQAQLSGKDVQGMQICQATGDVCSSITEGAKSVDNAYTDGEIDIGGIGANIPAGPVRLNVVIGYDG